MARYELPPTPSESEPEVRMSHCLERIVSLGVDHEDTRSWWRRTARDAASRYIDELPDGMTGGRSWNHAVAAGVNYALMENEHWDRVKTYAVHQLDGTHGGLWGQEGTSHTYPHPIPYLAVAYQHEPLPELERVLRAHAFLLALLALPRPYRKDRGDSDSEGPYGDGSAQLEVHVCAGGMRSQWPYRGNVFLSYALEILRGRSPKLPTWRSTHRRREGWSSRMMLHSRHDYLSAADRDLIERVIFQAEVEPLAAQLEELGVRARGTLHVLRYPADQGASYYERNTHPSTPPIMGQSWIRCHGYRTLCMHPDKLRGTPGGNTVGDVTARLEDGRILGKATGVRAAGRLGNWPPCTVDGEPPPPGSEYRVRGTVEASIPVPTDRPLWEVVIDRDGVTLVGGTLGGDDGGGTVGDDGDGDGKDGDPEDSERAVQLFAQVADSSGAPWIRHGTATGIEVLRRIVRRDRPRAAKGSRTLTRQLEKPLDLPSGSTDDPRVTEALGLLFQVQKASADAWVRQGIATGAEVLRRITRPDRETAVGGSRNLTKVLEA